MRERHCRRPRLPPRSCTEQAPSRAQEHPGSVLRRRNDPIASLCHGMRCPPVHPLFASWPWLPHTGCSLETIDMTVHERNYESTDSRFTYTAPASAKLDSAAERADSTRARVRTLWQVLRSSSPLEE